jgi:hypothetical protein
MEASTFFKVSVSSPVLKNKLFQIDGLPKKTDLPRQHFLVGQFELAHVDMPSRQLQRLIPTQRYQHKGLGGTCQTSAQNKGFEKYPNTNRSLPHI